MRANKIISALVATAAMAVASTNSCPNTTHSSTVSNGSASATTIIPGAGGGTPANDLVSLGVAGCTTADLAFSNFAETIGAGTAGLNGALTAAGTYLAEIPSGTSNSPLVDPDDLIFASVRGTAAAGAADGTANDGNNNFVSSHGSTTAGTIVDNIAYVAKATTPGSKIYAITLTLFNVVITTTGTAATGTFALDVCTGGTQTGVFTGGTCAGGGVFQHATFTLVSGATNTFTLNFAAPVTYADITSVISLTGHDGTSFAGFDAFSEQLDEAPEPSTFMLMGSALAGVIALRFRKGKLS